MKLLSTSCALVMVFGMMAEAEACRCRQPPAPKQALKDSAAVFSGKVTNIKTQGNVVTVTFEVDLSWKGVSNKTVDITTSTSSCGWKFTKGQSYLVYCGQAKGSMVLSTHLCTRTKAYGSAKDDLTELGEGKAPA